MNRFNTSISLITNLKPIISFQGALSSEVINRLLQQIEYYFEDEKVIVRKRLFHIATECLQNVYHHSNAFKQGNKSELNSIDQEFTFEVTMLEDGYVIEVGNYIMTNQVEGIKAKISEINSASLPELRQMYINQLINKRGKSANTAGLGFIEMAKRSKNRLEYVISPINSSSSFLRLRIKVN